MFWAEIYKIEWGDSSTCVNSFNLCLDCLAKLGDLAVKEHIKTGTGYCGKGATSSGECEAPCSSMYNRGKIFNQCHKLKDNLSLNDIEEAVKTYIF